MFSIYKLMWTKLGIKVQIFKTLADLSLTFLYHKLPHNLMQQNRSDNLQTYFNSCLGNCSSKRTHQQILIMSCGCPRSRKQIPADMSRPEYRAFCKHGELFVALRFINLWTVHERRNMDLARETKEWTIWSMYSCLEDCMQNTSES